MLQTIQILGKEIDSYKFFNAIGVIVFVLFAFLSVKRFQKSEIIARAIVDQADKPTARFFKRKQSLSTFMRQHQKGSLVFLCLIELTFVLLPYVLFSLILNRLYGRWFTENAANFFGNLTVWVIGVNAMGMLLGISPTAIGDILAPQLLLTLIPVKTACFLYGCCYGFVIESNLFFNYYTGEHNFPSQLLEVATALISFFVLMIYRKHAQHHGTSTPLMIILYAFGRFCTEFTRADLPNVLGFLDAYQILGLVYTVIGLIYFIFMYKYGERIELYFDRIQEQIYNKINPPRSKIRKAKKRRT